MKKIVSLLLLLVVIIGIYFGVKRQNKPPIADENPTKPKIITRVWADDKSGTPSAVNPIDREAAPAPSASSAGSSKAEAETVDFDTTRQKDTSKLTTAAEQYAADKKSRLRVACDDSRCSYFFAGLKADQSNDILGFLKGQGAFFLTAVKSYQVAQDGDGLRLDVNFYRDALEKEDEKSVEEDRLSEVQKQMDDVKAKSPNLDRLSPAEYLKAYLRSFIDQSVADSSIADISEYRVDCTTDTCRLDIMFKEGTPKRNVEEHRDFVFLFIKQIAGRDKVKEYSMSSTDSSASFTFILNQ
jgi:hypothetical protein